MATFRVHEDFIVNDENRANNTKISKIVKELEKKCENRTALQPINTICHRQNTKRLKLGPKEELLPIRNKPTVVQVYKKVDSSVGSSIAPDKNKQEPNNKVKNVLPMRTKHKFTATANLNKLQTFAPYEQEYSDEIWEYLITFESRINRVKPLYMDKQIHLTWDMRSLLIDWLVSVADEYKLNEQTIHLSVNYLDRFLSNISVIREKFQLVGAAAMMLAGKVEEIYPPDSGEWSYLTGDTFTIRQILKMEQLMLKVLEFEMHTPTILDFIRHLCIKHKIDNKTMYLAMYLSELVLLEGRDYLRHVPSKLAAASVALARHTLFKSEPWSKKMEKTAGYTLKQLSPVVQKQQRTFKSSPFKEQQAIQKKYATDKFQRVALLKPRILVLDDSEDEE